MVELGELEKHYADFAARRVRVVVIANDDQAASQSTQADYPHLVVVSDAAQSMARAIDVIHPGAGQSGDDTNAPTTFFVDGTGQVRWLRRPGHIIVRLSPEEL